MLELLPLMVKEQELEVLLSEFMRAYKRSNSSLYKVGTSFATGGEGWVSAILESDDA